ncbi:MAG: hypothetical protein KDA79_12130 [Planctomycetaceae bacterium]|nr:hypothetical protein [Planctomycetaceae bacterium]
MNGTTGARSLLHASLIGLLLLAGCGEPESRWDAAQKAGEENPVAVSDAALPGSTFNKFFPEQNDEIDIVFKQEKDGFAQASLRRSGDEIAMLSIADTRNNPEAREKYATAEVKVQGYPAVVRENTTSLLVADRFQVQIQSEGTALTAEDRAAWLKKFDLDGLANAF